MTAQVRLLTILQYGIHTGILGAVATARKVTVELPSDLLRRAQKSTGQGVTATIRKGLELVAASRTYDDLRRLKGRVSFSVDWKELRKDRP